MLLYKEKRIKSSSRERIKLDEFLLCLEKIGAYSKENHSTIMAGVRAAKKKGVISIAKS